MRAITVRGVETGTFLDRVVAHAVHHQILTTLRRRELFEESGPVHTELCQRLALNPVSIGETLQGAEHLRNLLSLGLEVLSHGNVETASSLLANMPVKKIVQEAMSRLLELRRRFEALERSSRHDFIMKHDALRGDLQITLSFVRNQSRHLASDAREVEATFEFFLERVKTHAALVEAEQAVLSWERELVVSLRYLPWEALRKQWGLEPVSGGEFSSAVVFHWGLESLLATLSVTLGLRGEHHGALAIPWKVFRHEIDRITKPAFRKKARADARSYLERRIPRPTPEDLTLLLELWEWALEQLLSDMPALQYRKIEVDAWAERVHLLARPRDVYLIGARGPGSKPRDGAGLMVDELEHLDEKAVRRGRLLGKLDWRKVNEHALTKLLDVVSPKTLIPVIPLEPRLALAVVGQWWSWDDADCRLLIWRLLREAPRGFWKQMPFTFIQALQAKAGPRQTTAIERLWKRLSRKRKRRRHS